jgi:hypothetical protein
MPGGAQVLDDLVLDPASRGDGGRPGEDERPHPTTERSRLRGGPTALTPPEDGDGPGVHLVQTAEPVDGSEHLPGMTGGTSQRVADQLGHRLAIPREAGDTGRRNTVEPGRSVTLRGLGLADDKDHGVRTDPLGQHEIARQPAGAVPERELVTYRGKEHIVIVGAVTTGDAAPRREIASSQLVTSSNDVEATFSIVGKHPTRPPVTR